MTLRARRPSNASVGNIQNGCTRLASASPKSYDVTTQPRCTFNSWAAAMTYGASITHFDPPEGTNTPSTAEYTATSAGNVVGVESPTKASAIRSLRWVVVMTPAMPA